MMLRTGNKGFTLLEVMLTTAVMSLGAALIYQSFFISLDSFNYSETVLNTIPWMDEKIWAAQDNLSHFGPAAVLETGGELKNNSGKNIIWNLSYNPTGGIGNLYQIDLKLSWPQDNRRIELSRSAYAIYPEK